MIVEFGNGGVEASELCKDLIPDTTITRNRIPFFAYLAHDDK